MLGQRGSGPTVDRSADQEGCHVASSSPRSGALTVLTFLTLLIFAAPSAAIARTHHHAGPSKVRLATQDGEHPLQIRPALVSYTGDGTGYLAGRVSRPGNLDRGSLRWRSWKRRSGFATGYAWINNCRPSCAGGHFSKHRATVRVRRPRHGIFTRMTIRFRYGARHIVDHRALRHVPASSYEGTYYPGYYEWTICGNHYTGPC
jgi:hypothetical protein